MPVAHRVGPRAAGRRPLGLARAGHGSPLPVPAAVDETEHCSVWSKPNGVPLSG
ncbi:hypothetical protein SFR_5157 [Streptomyces sp. FR-008]|nr:hypothetical protein SFR_5157 [Streptomyces sp. FR-008]